MYGGEYDEQRKGNFIERGAASRWWGLFWEGLLETQRFKQYCFGAGHTERGESSSLSLCTGISMAVPW